MIPGRRPVDAGAHPQALLREWAEATPIWFHGAGRGAEQTMGLPLIGSKGGVTIVGTDGEALGAVGIAGEAGEFDQAPAVLGIESAGVCAR